jgi:YVTN family beta-propeller protein
VGYWLGLDVGTTFSAAGVVRDGRAEIVGLGHHAAVVPSLLFLREDNSFVVGDVAARRGVAEPGRLARGFKRRFGDPTPVLLGGSPFSADALTSQMFRYLAAAVAQQEGAGPEAVAVTCPANWGPYKTELLGQALRAAGLSDALVLSEPEAAAVYYASTERVEPGQVVAIYDLGGGTFDSAVLRKTDLGFELLGAPEGIERLGGIDFDDAVLAHVQGFLGDALSRLDMDDPASLAALARLRGDCVDAKEALSDDTDVSIPVLLPTVQTEVRLTRSEFEAMIRPTLWETTAALSRALASARVTADELHAVLLVGGSSRIPMVGQLVAAELGRPVALDVHPKHAVAQGAALAAGRLDRLADPTPPARAPDRAEPAADGRDARPAEARPAAVALSGSHGAAAVSTGATDEPSASNLASKSTTAIARGPGAIDGARPAAVPLASEPAAASAPATAPTPAAGATPAGAPAPAADGVEVPAAGPAAATTSSGGPAVAAPADSAPAPGPYTATGSAATPVPYTATGSPPAPAAPPAPPAPGPYTATGAAPTPPAPPASPAPPAPAGGARGAPVPAPARAGGRFRRTPVLIGAGVGAVLIVVGAVAVLTRGHGPTGPPQHPPQVPTFNVQLSVNSMTAGAGSLWLGANSAPTVSRFDLVSHQLTQTIRVGDAQGNTSVTFGAGAVWAVNDGGTSAFRIDPATNSVTATYIVGRQPGGIVFAAGAVWVAATMDGLVTRIDPATGTTTPVHLRGQPTHMAVSGNTLLVTDQSNGDFARIDMATNTALADAKSGGCPDYLTADDRAVWAQDECKVSTIFKVDPTTGNVVGTVTVGRNAKGVALAGGSLYVANYTEGTVSRIDAATLAVTRTIVVGNGPVALYADGNTIWVANSSDSSLSRIDG